MNDPDQDRPRRSNYFAIRMGARLALLALLIGGGLIFHHRGHAYTTIRTIYIVAIVGLLIWRISYWQNRPRNNRNRGRDRDRGPMI